MANAEQYSVADAKNNMVAYAEKNMVSDVKILFSYSEWWRYIGPVKPRQPLKHQLKEGACLSESHLFQTEDFFAEFVFE